jgi:subtilisin family serine protease
VSGYDLIERDEKSWRTDLLGSGTAAASLFLAAGARDADGLSMTGVCREAELHVLKTMPGGHTSDLVEALDYCVDHGIDIVGISVGAPDPSPLLAAKLQQVHAAGVCVIAAAGDQPDALIHPAALPGVLACNLTQLCNAQIDRS